MALRIEGINQQFGKQQALHDVTIHVERGDCYGFIGHNGAGKTTAMRIMLGLLVPDSGRVLVDGFDARRYPREARARMGALIEAPGFHGAWSGKRNLMLLDRLAGGNSDLDGLLDLVGLGHVGNKPVRAYSQGMRQRLGVAQALLGEPRYILLDEPTNGLDPDGIAEMRQLLLRLTREENQTVFVSSHQLHELAGICNRVGVLRAGKLVLEERLEKLLVRDRYRIRTSDDQRATEILTGLGVEVREGSQELVASLGDRPPAEALQQLVAGGVEVSEYATKPPTLEEIYHREAEPVVAPAPLEVGPPAERISPSRPLSRMLGHEWRRWTGQLAVPLMLLLPTLVGLLAMMLRRQGMMADEEAIAAGDLVSATDINAFEAVARSMHAGVWLMCYIVLGLASQSIAGEFAQGTLRNVLLRPVTRLNVMIGKAVAVLGAALLSYLVLVLVSTGAAAWGFQFEGVFEILPNGKRFELTPAADLWPSFWQALRSPLLPLAAYAGIGFLAGTFLRRGASSLAVALGAGFLLDLGRDFSRGSILEGAFPPAYVPSLGRTSFVDFFLEESQGVSNALYLFEGTDKLVPLLWILLTFGLATILFRRRYVP